MKMAVGMSATSHRPPAPATTSPAPRNHNQPQATQPRKPATDRPLRHDKYETEAPAPRSAAILIVISIRQYAHLEPPSLRCCRDGTTRPLSTSVRRFRHALPLSKPMTTN